MADNSRVKKLVEQLEKAIEHGLNLFKGYKYLSKEFQEERKILMENRILKKKFANLKQKYDEEMKFIMAERKEIINNKESPEYIKKLHFKNTEVKEKDLKNNYKKEYDKKIENSLVNSNKKFLIKKENLRKLKKIILSKIKKAFSQLKDRMSGDDFKQLDKDIRETLYEVSSNKSITFNTLMNHLKSGEISEEVAKTTKKIDELKTIGNIVNRKKKMEIGIKQKEIEKLVKDFDKTMGSLKKIASAKFPNKNITNDDIESLLRIKYSKENSPEFKKMISKLGSNLRTLKYDIQIKMQELKKLGKSS